MFSLPFPHPKAALCLLGTVDGSRLGQCQSWCEAATLPRLPFLIVPLCTRGTSSPRVQEGEGRTKSSRRRYAYTVLSRSHHHDRDVPPGSIATIAGYGDECVTWVGQPGGPFSAAGQVLGMGRAENPPLIAPKYASYSSWRPITCLADCNPQDQIQV